MYLTCVDGLHLSVPINFVLAFTSNIITLFVSVS